MNNTYQLKIVLKKTYLKMTKGENRPQIRQTFCESRR